MSLALEADRAESERSASRRGGDRLGSGFLGGSRLGVHSRGRSTVATAARRRAAIARRAAITGRAAAVAGTIVLALALVTGFDVAVGGEHGDAHDSEEDGKAENQSTIHPRYLHCKRTVRIHDVAASLFSAPQPTAGPGEPDKKNRSRVPAPEEALYRIGRSPHRRERKFAVKEPCPALGGGREITSPGHTTIGRICQKGENLDQNGGEAKTGRTRHSIWLPAKPLAARAGWALATDGSEGAGYASADALRDGGAKEPATAHWGAGRCQLGTRK